MLQSATEVNGLLTPIFTGTRLLTFPVTSSRVVILSRRNDTSPSCKRGVSRNHASSTAAWEATRTSISAGTSLFIAGGEGPHPAPAVQRENYQKNAKHSTAITGYKLFPNRDHFTCGAPGWEEVADFALDWALNPQAIHSPAT